MYGMFQSFSVSHFSTIFLPENKVNLNNIQGKIVRTRNIGGQFKLFKRICRIVIRGQYMYIYAQYDIELISSISLSLAIRHR